MVYDEVYSKIVNDMVPKSEEDKKILLSKWTATVQIPNSKSCN